MDLVFILFIALVGGGWLIGNFVGNLLIPNKKPEKYTFINNSVHYHEHKSISIIDDTTKNKILEIKNQNTTN